MNVLRPRQGNKRTLYGQVLRWSSIMWFCYLLSIEEAFRLILLYLSGVLWICKGGGTLNVKMTLFMYPI